ncbi:MAG: flagellar FliJ family protein [Gammaproteobacteria bacterium]
MSKNPAMKSKLAVALELAERNERQESQRLARLTQQMQQQENQRRQLESYSNEYLEHMSQTDERALGANQYRDRHAFVEHIRHSIRLQQSAIARIREQLDRQNQRWRDARTRVESLRKGIEKAARARAQLRDRRAEQQAEEFAQRMPLRQY